MEKPANCRIFVLFKADLPLTRQIHITRLHASTSRNSEEGSLRCQYSHFNTAYFYPPQSFEHFALASNDPVKPPQVTYENLRYFHIRLENNMVVFNDIISNLHGQYER